MIKDRNGKLLVYNTPEYDLQIITSEVMHFDSTKFCDIFDMGLVELRGRFKELRTRKEYSPVKPITFIPQLSNYDFARIQDYIDEFPGFYIQARTTRAYTSTAAANALGYVSEISKSQLDNDKSKVYKQGDYIGQSGIESYYEEYRAGQRGVRFTLRNVKGESSKGSFA
ncbi:MAG: peptidoglycan glycosyltransferase, partial [Bacteroidia bacterium]|nr:peptidoglycan glycosyltransferase [Bacteroidia bacterium]